MQVENKFRVLSVSSATPDCSIQEEFQDLLENVHSINL